VSLPAVCTGSLSGGHDYGALVFILVVCGLVAVVGAVAAAQNNAMWTELRTRATDLGWTEVSPEEAPREIAQLVGWRRPRRVLRGPAGGDPMWLVWHQWTRRRGKSRSTHNATRLLVARPVDWPDFTVVRRTVLGAKLMPVNGPGTGDRDFDREYFISIDEPTDTPVVLTPDIRAALLSGEIVPFAVRATIATILLRRVPDVELFDTQTPIMARVLALLTGGRPGD
jgi:hypothetical protein